MNEQIAIHISTLMKSYYIESCFVPSVGDTLELENVSLVVISRAWDIKTHMGLRIRDVRLDCEVVS